MKYNRVLLSSLNVLDHIKELFENSGTSNHVPQFNIIFCFVVSFCLSKLVSMG